MQQYYKLQDGALQSMPKPKRISNPTEAVIASLAKEQGYKEFRPSAPPSPYHTSKPREYDDYIGMAWYKPTDIDALKATLKQEAERERDSALAAPTVLEVEGVGSVLYNAQAITNVTALVAKLPFRAKDYQVAFILADDSVAMLNAAQLVSISDVMENHVQDIYSLKMVAFAAIDAAETIEELLTLNQQ